MANFEFPSVKNLTKMEDVVDRVENMRKEMEFSINNLDNNAAMASNFASGTVSITPSAANTPTALYVPFGKTFRYIPIVVCTPVTGYPGVTVTGVGVTDITTAGCTIWVSRTNTTITYINWIAVDV